MSEVQCMNTKKAEDISNDYIDIVDWECSLEKQFQIQINESKNCQLSPWQDYIEH